MPSTRPIHEVSFVAFDLEATGLIPMVDTVTELGAVRFRITPDGTVKQGPVMESLVCPGRPIPPRVRELTGIDDAMVQGAPTLEDLWPRWITFLTSEEPTVLMAHNVRSDLSFLDSACRDMGVQWTPPPALCTVRLARLLWPEAPRYGLQTLLDWLEPEREDSVHHRALPDALHTRKLFSRCVEKIHQRNTPEVDWDSALVPTASREVAVDAPPRLAALAEAAREGRQVHLIYRGGSKGRERRPITPLGFFQQGEQIYLRGWCHLDDLPKVFRCDKIRGLASI